MISDKAVEAAAKAHCERGDSDWQDWTWEAKAEALDDIRAAVEAAAPYIMAAALEEAAKDLAFGFGPVNQRRPDEWLNARAWKLRHSNQSTNPYRS